MPSNLRHLAALRGLRFRAPGRCPRRRDGARPGRGTGQSLDFADLRAYSPGDDLRLVDWTLYARLGAPFTRRFHAEVDLEVHLLLDVSASMRFGRPSKLEASRRIAEALAVVALAHHDSVALRTFAEDVRGVVGPGRSRHQLARIRALLDSEPGDRPSDFARSLRTAAASVPIGATVVVLSDLISEGGCETGLTRLLRRRPRLTLIQILAPEESRPTIGGELLLEDLEAPGRDRLAVDPAAVDSYRRAFARGERRLDVLCRRHGVRRLRTTPSLTLPSLARDLVACGVWEA